MRKGALAGLLALAGCEQASDAPQLVPTNSAVAKEPAAIPAPSAEANPNATPPPVSQMHFQATGTEPFWAIEVLPGELRYAAPEQPDGITFAARASSLGSGYRYAGTMAGAPVTLAITPGTCSDGMSDRVYAYTAALTIDGLVMHGCARLN